MKKLFGITISIILLIIIMTNITYAEQQSLLPIKLNECITLKQTCSNCSYSNITGITKPNNTYIVVNYPMTKQGTSYNYSYCNTNDNGQYIIDGLSDVDGIKTVWAYDFIVTPTGKALDDSSSLIYAIILALMFGVTIFFLLFANQTTSAGVKLFFNMVGYLTMTFTVGTAYVFVQSAGVQSNVSNLVRGLMILMGIILILIMYYVFLNQTRQAIQLMKAKKGYGSIESSDNF